MPLRHLAGGAIHNTMLAFRVQAQSEFYNSVWLCVHAAHAKLKLTGIPFDDFPFLELLERGFRAKSRLQVHSKAAHTLD